MNILLPSPFTPRVEKLKSDCILSHGLSMCLHSLFGAGFLPFPISLLYCSEIVSASLKK